MKKHLCKFIICVFTVTVLQVHAGQQEALQNVVLLYKEAADITIDAVAADVYRKFDKNGIFEQEAKKAFIDFSSEDFCKAMDKSYVMLEEYSKKYPITPSDLNNTKNLFSVLKAMKYRVTIALENNVDELFFGLVKDYISYIVSCYNHQHDPLFIFLDDRNNDKNKQNLLKQEGIRLVNDAQLVVLDGILGSLEELFPYIEDSSKTHAIYIFSFSPELLGFLMYGQKPISRDYYWQKANKNFIKFINNINIGKNKLSWDRISDLKKLRDVLLENNIIDNYPLIKKTAEENLGIFTYLTTEDKNFKKWYKKQTNHQEIKQIEQQSVVEQPPVNQQQEVQQEQIQQYQVQQNEQYEEIKQEIQPQQNENVQHMAMQIVWCDSARLTRLSIPERQEVNSIANAVIQRFSDVFDSSNNKLDADNGLTYKFQKTHISGHYGSNTYEIKPPPGNRKTNFSWYQRIYVEVNKGVVKILDVGRHW